MEKEYKHLIAATFITAAMIILLYSCGTDLKPTPEKTSIGTELGSDEEVLVFKNWSEVDETVKNQFLSAYDEKNIERREVFETFYDSIGPRAFLDFTEDKYAKCHNESHDIGKTIYKIEQDIIKALRICENRCTNGCMHGVVAEAYGDKAFEDVVKEMKKFCSTGVMTKLHKPGNCAHAMGHAFMLLNDYKIDRAIAGCNSFETPPMSYYCATGVYMEFSDKLILQEELGQCGSVNRDSLHYPCNTYSQYPAACYRYTLGHIAKDLSVNLKMVVEECLKLPANKRVGCFHGLGSIYSRAIAKNPKLLNATCMVGNHEEKVVCIEGVIEKLADYNEEEARNICQFADGEYKDVCLLAAEEKMYRLTKPSIGLYTN